MKQTEHSKPQKRTQNYARKEIILQNIIMCNENKLQYHNTLTMKQNHITTV